MLQIDQDLYYLTQILRAESFHKRLTHFLCQKLI